MRPLVIAAMLCGAATIANETAHAQTAKAPVQSGNPAQTGGYFSWRLGARFELQWMQIPGYRFWGARIVSQPVPGSPLDQLGLNVGDVITRLDGTRVTNYGELDRHHLRTYVRYIRTGTVTPINGIVNIPRYYVFREPVSTVMWPGTVQSP